MGRRQALYMPADKQYFPPLSAWKKQGTLRGLNHQNNYYEAIFMLLRPLGFLIISICVLTRFLTPST